MSVKSSQNKPLIQHKSKQTKLLLEKEAYGDIPKWVPIAILVFTALLFTKALYNGFVTSWDDDIYILQNPFIRDFSVNGIKSIFTSFYNSNYHPLTTLTFLFEFTWYGLNPLFYHLLNVLIHLLNTWLVFKLVEQLSGKKITAIVVSLLFAIHPMHVESVAWISERKDVLYSLFYLLSLLLYLRYMKSGYRIKHYFGALLLFLASLLSKPAAVTLPVLLIALDVYKGRKINGKSLMEKIPFLLLSLLFGILTILSQQTGKAISDFSFSYSFIDRIFLFTYTIAFYIVKLVVPFSLSAMYYFPDTHGGALPWQYYASLPFLLLIGWLLLRRTLLRKEIMFGVFFFLITISVMLQVVSVGMSLASERYTYLPYIGLFYIVGQCISDIGKKQVKTAYRIGRNAVITLFSLFVIMFSYQTYDRIGAWKDSDILFTDIIKKNPDYFYCYWMRGIVKSSKNDFQGALQDFNKSILLNPEFAESYNDRGSTYDGLGNAKSAMLDYNKAIQLKPELADAYNNRGAEYFKLGDTKSAMADYNKAILLNHQLVEVYCNRGWLKTTQKDYKGSIEDFNYSLKLKSNNSRIYYVVYYLRGISRINLNDTTGACQDWKKAMELGNKDAAKLASKYCH